MEYLPIAQGPFNCRPGPGFTHDIRTKMTIIWRSKDRKGRRRWTLNALRQWFWHNAASPDYFAGATFVILAPVAVAYEITVSDIFFVNAREEERKKRHWMMPRRDPGFMYHLSFFFSSSSLIAMFALPRLVVHVIHRGGNPPGAGGKGFGAGEPSSSAKELLLLVAEAVGVKRAQ